jgi:peptidoglycan/LPS O-acetylase OafA/YrhL
MGELLFVKQVKLGDFFIRRATRVLPTFCLFVLTMACVTLAQPAWQVSSADLLATLTFLSTYFPPELSAQGNFWPVQHIWSLNVEEHTYVWLAACAVLVRMLRLPVHWVLCGTFILSLACMGYYMSHPAEAAVSWQLHTEVAAMGIVASAAVRCLPAIGRKPLTLPLLFACALSALCFAKYEHKGVHLWLSPLCLAFAVNYVDSLPSMLLRALALPWLRWFGRCSFSIYLWQQPFFSAVNRGALHPGVALLASLLVGALSFYLFEDPVRRYLNRKWAERPQRPQHAYLSEAVDTETAHGPG